MQKVKLLVHQSDTDVALALIQKTGAVQFEETLVEQSITPVADFAFANIQPRTEHVVTFLKPYKKKRGLLKTLREGSQVELTETAVAKVLSDTDAVEAVVSDIEQVQVEFAEKTEVVRILEEQYKKLTAWKALPFRLSELETKHTVTKLVELDQAVKPETSLATQLSRALSEVCFAYSVTEVSPCLAALTLPKTVSLAEVVAILAAIKSEIIEVPKGVETPEIEITAVAEKLAAAKGELALVHDQAEHFAHSYLTTLRIAKEVFSWAKERHTVLQTAATTKRTVLFTGWLNVNRRSQVEIAFAKQNIAAVLIDIDPNEDEQPPVDIENNKWIQPFEMVTRLYGMPGYKDLDPTLFLAGFFFLFFGLSLTDVGYGFFLMIASGFIIFFCKVPAGMRIFAKLLFFMGVATVLVGMLFGGYLGIAPEMLPESLKAIQMFDPIGNPLPVFYLALSLGVVQVMVGLMLKIYSESRNGNLMGGILDQGPWLYMFVLGILFVLTSIDYIAFISVDQIVNLVYVGVLLIIITSARTAKGPFDAIMKAAGSLYGSIGYFSDILSYSRLLALGLATTALAYAVNLIAGIVYEAVPYFGVVFAALILIIGHLFTLAVNTLGAFIHSARLQFVEFFGKFIAGTGKEFKPLSRTEEFVTVAGE